MWFKYWITTCEGQSRGMLLGLKYFEAKFTEEHVGTAEQIVSLSTYHLLIQVESWVSFPEVKLNK